MKMSNDIKVNTAIVIQIILNGKIGLGYELQFIGFDTPEQSQKFVDELKINTETGSIVELLPIYRIVAEKYGLQYRETVLAKRKGLSYWLLRFASKVYHAELNRIGEFKYKINHKIKRIYE
jgi:hypothetical protein